MSEMQEVPEVEMDEDWTDTRWASPDSAPNTKEAIEGTQTNEPEKGTENLANEHSQADATTENTEDKGSLKPGEATTEKQLMSRMALNDNKAGMEGLDKERINQIIYEASKGSRFYENELRREKQTNAKIEDQTRKMGELDENQLKQGEKEADKLLQELEETRDLGCTVMHIDMDAFYAAVEMRDNSDLKHKPMAVGGSSMLSTSNYLARRFGVRAAMPGFIGKKLCPELVIVPTNFAKYTEVSNQVRGILKEYDPNFCPMSLDEAYLDLTSHLEKRKDMSEEERTFYQVHTPAAEQSDEPPVEPVEDINSSVVTGDSSFAVLDTDTEFSNMLNTTSTTETSEDVIVATAGVEDAELSKDQSVESVSQDSIGVVDSEPEKPIGSAVDTNTEVEITSTTLEDSVDVPMNGEGDAGISQVEENKQHGSEAEGTSLTGGEDEKENNAHVTTAENKDSEGTKANSEVSQIVASSSENAEARKGTPVTFGVSAMEAVREIRFRIEQKTGLTASAGIAPNMMLAKVCSDKNKPNGQYFIPPNKAAVMDFVNTLPIRKVQGIGKVLEKMLSAIDVKTCADLHKKRGLLYHLYSKVSFNYFMHICLGMGSTKVRRETERKSISTEQTFSEMTKPVEMFKKLYELCDSVASDLHSEAMMGKTVTIKLKTVEFELKTRCKTLNNPTNQQTTIYAEARELLRTEIEACKPQSLRLRLMGVRVSNLSKTDKGIKKQSTITELFAGQKSPRKHKLPVDSEDSDVVPAKRRRLEVEDASEKSAEKEAEKNRSPSEDSFDSNATDMYWSTSKDSADIHHADTDTGRSDEDCSVKGSESQTSSSDASFAKPPPVPSSASHESLGTKARDTPTTTALIKAQGSEPIGCPVCAREFKSRNMTHITRHIERCLEATSAENATAPREGGEPDSEELFEDESDDFFSSRGSQMILSQEAKKTEDEEFADEIEGTNGHSDAVNNLAGTMKGDRSEEVDDSLEERKEPDETSGVPIPAAKEAEAPEDDNEAAKDAETVEDDIEPEVEENELEDNGMDQDEEESYSDTPLPEQEFGETAPDDVENAEGCEKPEERGSVYEGADVNGSPEKEDNNLNGPQDEPEQSEATENGLEIPPPTDMLCPVCNIVQVADMRLFNLHVDRCLKKQELYAKEDNSEPAQKAGTSKTEGTLGYLKGITPRRPLRTDGGASSFMSPSSSRSALGKVKYDPVRTTVSHRATHTSVTKQLPNEGVVCGVDDEETEMVCPLCNVAMYNVSLTSFNQHVDTCLNRQTIKQLIHQQNKEEDERSEEPASDQNTKKRKLSGLQQMSNPMKKIYSFFKKS